MVHTLPCTYWCFPKKWKNKKERKKKIMYMTYLAGYKSAVEYRLRGIICNVGRKSMDINWIKPLMPFEKFLPQWCQRQWPPCQKHESNFRYPFERVFFHRRHDRCTPEELLICHWMDQIRRRLDPPFQAVRFLWAWLEMVQNCSVNPGLSGHEETENWESDSHWQKEEEHF